MVEEVCWYGSCFGVVVVVMRRKMRDAMAGYKLFLVGGGVFLTCLRGKISRFKHIWQAIQTPTEKNAAHFAFENPRSDSKK